MSDTIEIAVRLSDADAVALLKRIDRAVTEALSDDDLRKLPVANAGLLEPLAVLDEESRNLEFDPDVSIDVSRRILRALAGDPNLSPLVLQALNEMQEDDSLLIIGTIVAVGLVANLTLFMATSEIEFQVGTLNIKKGKANPQLVKAVFQPLVDLVKELVKKAPLRS